MSVSEMLVPCMYRDGTIGAEPLATCERWDLPTFSNLDDALETAVAWLKARERLLETELAGFHGTGIDCSFLFVQLDRIQEALVANLRLQNQFGGGA